MLGITEGLIPSKGFERGYINSDLGYWGVVDIPVLIVRYNDNCFAEMYVDVSFNQLMTMFDDINTHGIETGQAEASEEPLLGGVNDLGFGLNMLAYDIRNNENNKYGDGTLLRGLDGCWCYVTLFVSDVPNNIIVDLDKAELNPLTCTKKILGYTKKDKDKLIDVVKGAQSGIGAIKEDITKRGSTGRNIVSEYHRVVGFLARAYHKA